MAKGPTPARPENKSARTARDDEKRPPAWVVPAVMIGVLTLGGWYIIQNLTETSKMEDCTMAGRHNCVPPIDTSKVER